MHFWETPGETLEIPIGVGGVGPTAGLPTHHKTMLVLVVMCIFYLHQHHKSMLV